MESSVSPEDLAATLQFGAELQRLREMAGLSQRALGRAIGISGQQLGAVERAKRNPSKSLAESADRHLGANGSLLALWPKGRRTPHRWLEDYVELEAKAQALQIFHCQIVPGLFQTADYARQILKATWPPHTEAQVEAHVRGRMRRQEVFERDTPPIVSVVLDEAALLRGAGDEKIMHDQVSHLIKMAGKPFVEFQILPLAAGLHAGTEGSFIVLEMTQTESVVYVEPPGHGQLLTDAEVVANCGRRFGSLRGQAMSPAETLAYLQELQGGDGDGA